MSTTKKDKIGQILFNLPAETIPNALVLYIMKHLPDLDEEGSFTDGKAKGLDFSSIPSTGEKELSEAFGVSNFGDIVKLGRTIKQCMESEDGIVDLVKKVTSELPVNQVGLLIAVGIKALPEMMGGKSVGDLHLTEEEIQKYISEMM